ncbi:hypothetical protein [Blastococcus xanthinilyticus]|uniref:Excreted virulence factor EspC (Type VII ESX diderm) n=1 Tax=Blastococcus xanthinilyticus TaxID=1564164 RepID=A0A5S5CQ57_9ACTN|nr:hypothetical protein [Blastococcus xanthinilyticus]TYP83652.1 hypothetical protein BD833_11610 [Blastococcus xanthinilyticus]
MNDGLEVETSVLHDAGRALVVVYQEFEGARDTADVGSDVIAHARLRDRLAEFATSWDGRRIEMAGMIEGLGKAAEDAADVYERIETELVAVLAGEK